MKRLFLSLATFAILGGCVSAGPGSVGVHIPWTNIELVPEPGVELEIFNYCTPVSGRVYPSTGKSAIVPSGGPTYLFVPYAGNSAKATYTQFGGQSGQQVVGTSTHSLTQYYRAGVRTVQWIIGGNSKGGGTDVIIDHIKSIC